MQDPSPPPRLSPTPVSPGALLLRQFVTLLLLMISLAISFAFLFVQQVPTNTSAHSTILIIWGGVRPDMLSNAVTPHLNDLGQNGIVAQDQHANLSFVAPTATVSVPPTAGATVTPVATGTSTPAPTGTATPSPGPSATNAPTADVGTLANLAQAALAKQSSISYEGEGGAALLSALPNPAGHAFILDDQTTYPASLSEQMGAKGVRLPTSAASATPDVARIQALTQAYLQVILPQLSATAKATSTPFLSIIREPEPVTSATAAGIGSATFTAALRADDDALGDLISGLRDAGLLDTTNVVVTSDHGSADVVPPDQTSAGQVSYTAPTDALRTDLAQRLRVLAQAGSKGSLPDVGKAGVARSGTAITRATTVVVTPQGGYDILSLTPSDLLLKAGQGDVAQGKKVVARELVHALQALPQVGTIFVNDGLGTFDGALPLSQLGPLTPQSPDLFVGFVSFARDVGQRGSNIAQLAGSEYADTSGIATWGALGRRDIHCVLYLTGPNFKSGGNYSDLAPTGFADLAPTLEVAMGFDTPTGQGGRVITEALATDSATASPPAPTTSVASAKVTLPDGSSYVQVVVYEHFAGTTYLHGAYGLHAQGTQNLDDLVMQATALANVE